MSVYGKVFASFYDKLLQGTEDAGLRERRRALLAGASGRVLELGAGTGLNVALYPTTGIDELVLAEPEAPMAQRLRERAAARTPAPTVVQAPAEALPFGDGEFDTVVATLVFCTVGDLPAAIAEARRVLKPGGRLLFLEHVRADDDPGLAKWQDRLHGPWKAFGHGCHDNRSTVAAIRAAAFAVEEVEQGRMPKAPPIVRPMAWGTAIAV